MPEFDPGGRTALVCEERVTATGVYAGRRHARSLSYIHFTLSEACCFERDFPYERDFPA